MNVDINTAINVKIKIVDVKELTC